jgi:hypothetical protein
MISVRRLSLAAIASVLVAGILTQACTSIPAPAERPDGDAATGLDGLDGGSDAVADGASRCRGGGWRSLRGVGFLLDGDKPGTRTLVASGTFTEGDAGTVVYQVLVTGVPDQLVGRAPVELGSGPNADIRTCAFCALASGSCIQVSPEVASCEGSYQAIAGQARVITFPATDGGVFWVEVGNVVLARVKRRGDFTVSETDPNDCIELDRLTLEGLVQVVPRPCPTGFDFFCHVADTASQR